MNCQALLPAYTDVLVCHPAVTQQWLHLYRPIYDAKECTEEQKN